MDTMAMDNFKTLKDLLFIDIETVSAFKTYDQLDTRLQPLWDRKSSIINSEQCKKEVYYEKGGIYAEFGKIVTISFGCFYVKDKELAFKVKSLFGCDEIKILFDFCELLKKYKPGQITFCAHNGKEFDYPYLCRRMIINEIPLPEALDMCGKKPWEIKHLDTLEMWKFGDRKNYTSLDLLAAVLGIPSSKDDINGSEVNSIYHETLNVERIARYCEKDVIVTAQVYLKLTGKGLVKDQNIVYA